MGIKWFKCNYNDCDFEGRPLTVEHELGIEEIALQCPKCKRWTTLRLGADKLLNMLNA